MNSANTKKSLKKEQHLMHELNELLLENNITDRSGSFHDLLRKAIDINGENAVVIKRLEEIQDVFLAMINLDFSNRIAVSDDPDLIDFFANGLNSLNEELNEKVISKEKVDSINLPPPLTNKQFELLENSKNILTYYNLWEFYVNEAQDGIPLSNYFEYLSTFTKTENIKDVAKIKNVTTTTVLKNINKACRVLWTHPTEKKRYKTWVKENTPVRLLTKKDYERLKDQIRCEVLNQQLQNLQEEITTSSHSSLELTLSKPIEELKITSEDVQSLNKIGIIFLKDLQKFDHSCLKEKGITKNTLFMLKVALSEINCPFLLKKNLFFDPNQQKEKL